MLSLTGNNASDIYDVCQYILQRIILYESSGKDEKAGVGGKISECGKHSHTAPIIGFFISKYEKLKYWLYQEEVFEELKEDPYFEEYTMEQCQQDLAALTSWGNLVTIQDTRKVTTIEEFKNKKFRYQLSETAVEIERMVIRLENLFIEGSSLEPTLLERIRLNLGKIEEMAEKEEEKLYSGE